VDGAWLADLAAGFGGTGEVEPVESPAGALIAYAGPVVVKVHHPRTDRRRLAARLRAAADPRLADLLLAPLSTAVHPTPDGRAATVWPRVEVLQATDDEHPWAAAGALLGRLHQGALEPIAGLPATCPTARLERALRRIQGSSYAQLLDRVGSTVVAEVGTATECSHLVHGDWHLGQLGRRPDDGWRLLDVDDLGVGDPAWDLARPAGFWAAGLLADPDWEAFLAAYRRTGGPAVPPDGDPWPRLELPARAAVVLAACRAVARPRPGEDEAAEVLLGACARM
jgi:hypothetical protein